MNVFKTKISSLVVILRILTFLFLGSLTLILISAYIASFILSVSTPVEIHIGMLVFIPILILVFLSFFRPFISKTKNYLIDEESIEEFNIITRSKIKYDKSLIKGFSTSSVRYQFGTFKQIIIHHESGKKIELVQFLYTNFKKIEPALIENKYNFLGKSKSKPYLGPQRMLEPDRVRHQKDSL